jgi:polyisoprenoid-binding protein YceI
MTRWIFEPGHTAAEFRARHMMVTLVRGFFKDIHGEMDFDWETCLQSTFRGAISLSTLDTGEPQRDAHLRSADFFDAENDPEITFDGRFTQRTGDHEFKGETDLTIRGTTKTVPLDIVYSGQWLTPWWEGDENRGEMRRIGFEASTRVNRHDFGVSWQDELPNGGVVAGDHVDLFLDVEAIAEEDLERTGAISHYEEKRVSPELCRGGSARYSDAP